jgi:hypothetical protein
VCNTIDITDVIGLAGWLTILTNRFDVLRFETLTQHARLWVEKSQI